MPRRRAPVAGTAVISICLLLLVACLPPSQDAFYEPADPLSVAAPGEIIRSRSSVYTLDAATKEPVPGINSWQIMYRSTNAIGDPIAATATVLVPSLSWLGFGSRPVIAYSVGTRGAGRDCAPSYTLTNGTDYEGTFIQNALNRGWAVVVPDYEGFGLPGPHTYMANRSAGQVTLDATRAALRFDPAGLASNARIGLVGYSQGGGAAGWAAELAGTYAPELNIRGAAVGGVPSDLSATAEALDNSPAVALALLAAVGLDTAHPELNLAGYLNERGQQLYDHATADGTCLVSFDGFDLLIDTAFTAIDDYVDANPLTTPAWQQRLDEQLLGSVTPMFPVYQYHGLLDTTVPYPQGKQLRDTWCAAGATVYFDAPLTDHVGTALTNVSLGLDWMGRRFDGWAATSNCWVF